MKTKSFTATVTVRNEDGEVYPTYPAPIQALDRQEAWEMFRQGHYGNVTVMEVDEVNETP